MSDLRAATNIDPNVWYHVTEGRVDDHKKDKFGSMLQIVRDDFLAVWSTAANQYWQFQPVDDKPGRYALRCSKTTIAAQLSVCWRRDEVDSDRTRPCMAPSAGGDEQKWDVADWGNDTYRFVNVRNGSGRYLDVHPGSPAFMSSNTNTRVYQAAQHWLMTSAKRVDDGAYSTVFSDVAVSTSTTKTILGSPSGTSSPDSSSGSGSGSTPSGGLSSGAKAGIGIGIPLGVIALALAAFFLLRLRQRAARASARAELGPSTASDKHPSSPGSESAPPGYASSYQPVGGEPPPLPLQEMLHSPAPQEVFAAVPQELDSRPLRDNSPPLRYGPGGGESWGGRR